MGIQSLYQNTIGAYNTATGSLSLTQNTSGNENAAHGYRALFSNTTGNKNTAMGPDALRLNQQGSYNTAVGDSALASNTTESFNTALGYKADVTDATITNGTAIGNGARIGSSHAMAFGNNNVLSWSFARTTNDAGNALQVGTFASNGNGAYLTSGGAWTNTSDIHLKTNLQAIDHQEILEKISSLDIKKWDYTGTPVRETHIGPMAQQFKQLFGLGLEGNDTSISTIDPAGVALVGIQALKEQNDRLFSMTETQQIMIETQQIAIEMLVEKMTDLETRLQLVSLSNQVAGKE